MINTIRINKSVAILSVVFLCAFSLNAQTATKTILANSPISSKDTQKEIEPLTIGDKVPDIEIDNIINYSTSKARLSDFKGKLIIIDFWGKYCSSCITALPKIDSLQKIYQDKLQVITVTQLGTKEEILNVLKRYKKTENLKLPIVITDNTLSSYFPYQLVSHVVWIDGKGIVKAITGTEYITSENIKDVIEGEEINWPVKKDIFEYDYKKPFLDFAQKEIVKPDFLYSSAFTGHLEGISPPQGRIEDTVSQTAKISFYNESLLSLSQMALEYRTGAKPKNFVLEVKDTTRYIRDNTEYFAEWAKKNTYCYSLTVPFSLTEMESEQVIKNDLMRWLNIMGINVKKEKRLVKCLTLVQITNDEKLILPKSSKQNTGFKEFDSRKHLISSSISDLIERIDKSTSSIYKVFNETCIADDRKIDMVLKINSFQDIPALKKELQRYGLDLISDEREMEMYVVTEKGFETK